jgi:hypothetical protein
MSEDMLEKLLDANIDHILFSAQTPDEKSFKLRRTKIDFYEYKKHICVLIAKILKRKSNTKVSLSFLTTPFKKIILPSREFSIIDNKKDLIGHLGSWLDAILKELPEGDAKTQFSLYMTKLQNRLLSFNMLVWNRFKITNNFILETRVLGDWVHDGLFAQDIHKAAIGSCEGLSKHFGILWNGDMVFCCVDYDGKTRFENVRVTSIARALEQEKVQNAFRGFKKLLVKDQYCQRCIGDVSFERSILRQIGSILYFKIYRPWWEKMSEWEDAPA